ncbi:MAG: hypothetical protein ACI8UO_004741 [Verrucomicrobiales bacterium]|jgi:hypothetical protein
MKTSIFALTIAGLLGGSAFADFKWVDEAGKHTDLLFNGKKIVRYVYEGMNPEDRERTYKPFHHVYDSKGEGFLTKGPGGQYTHHRGIYFGFSKCKLPDGSGVDSWHCKGGYQQHSKVVEQIAKDDTATQTVEIEWRKDDGTVFIVESRTLTFTPAEDGLHVDFKSTLTSPEGTVKLDGDPQHAGFQFRASNEVSAKTKGQTIYTRPGTGAAKPGATINWGKDKGDDDSSVTNLPWKGMSVVVGGDRYTIVYLDSPDNPKPARYSERDYGRFGSYFVSEVSPDKPLTVNYGLFITAGELTPEKCQQLHTAKFGG